MFYLRETEEKKDRSSRMQAEASGQAQEGRLQPVLSDSRAVQGETRGCLGPPLERRKKGSTGPIADRTPDRIRSHPVRF